MNIHLELAKMVCMGWRSDVPSETKRLLEAYFKGYTLNIAEQHLIGCAVRLLERQEASKKLSPENEALLDKIVPPNNVSVDKETKAIGSTTLVKRRGCPPGGWPKKDKPAEHD